MSANTWLRQLRALPFRSKYTHVMLTVGSQGVYEWLVTDERFDLLQLCPQIVLGKFVAVTSIDSSELVPNDKETAAGWQSHERIAYSPKINSAEELPREGWDEWYIFDNPTDLGTSHLQENIFEVPRGRGHVSVFVNYCFALHQPEMESIATLFWHQMDWVRPESYVADNDYLNFVSVNKALFASVHDAVKALGTH
jgi:hypothetical protein